MEDERKEELEEEDEVEEANKEAAQKEVDKVEKALVDGDKLVTKNGGPSSKRKAGNEPESSRKR